MPNNEAAKYVLDESNKRLAKLLGVSDEELVRLKEKYAEPEQLRECLRKLRGEREDKLEKLLSVDLFGRAKAASLTAQKVTDLLNAIEEGGEDAARVKIEEFEKRAREMDKMLRGEG